MVVNIRKYVALFLLTNINNFLFNISMAKIHESIEQLLFEKYPFLSKDKELLDLIMPLATSDYPSSALRDVLRKKIEDNPPKDFFEYVIRTFQRVCIEGWALEQNVRLKIGLYSLEQDRNAFFGSYSSQYLYQGSDIQKKN